MKHELLIIMPAYNEAESIGKFLISLKEANIMEYADIVVINDASSDATLRIVQELGIPVISHPYNLGYGSSLQTGYRYAVHGNYRYIIQIDSDGQHDACNIRTIYDCLLKKDESGRAPDLVIGSRFLDDSKSFFIPFTKKVAICFFQKVIKFVTHQKITDPTSGLQGLNQSVFEYYSHFRNFDNKYPDANMLTQMALLGFQIKEIPAVMHQRTAGRSMHFGIIEPILYMCVMVFSTNNIFIRSKWNLLPKPNIDRGETTSDEN